MRLFENPNQTIDGNEFFNGDAIPFYIFEGKTFIAFNVTENATAYGYSHGEIKDFYLRHNNLFPNDVREKFPTYNEYNNIINGRVFCKNHLITFWLFPRSQQELNYVIQSITREYNRLSQKIHPAFNLDVRYIEVPKYLEKEKEIDNFPKIKNTDFAMKIINVESYEKYLNSMNSEVGRLKKLMNIQESPDKIESGMYRKTPLDFYNDNLIIFGYIGNDLYITIRDLSSVTSIKYSTHTSIPEYYNMLSNSEKYPKDEKHLQILTYLDDDSSILSRDIFTYSGRIWAEHDIISFWDYPSNLNQLNKIISDIKSEIKVIGQLTKLPESILNVNIKYVDIPKPYTAFSKSYLRYNNWETPPYDEEIISIESYDKYKPTD